MRVIILSQLWCTVVLHLHRDGSTHLHTDICSSHMFRATDTNWIVPINAFIITSKKINDKKVGRGD